MPLNYQATVNLLLADDDKDDRFFFEKALKEVNIPTHFTSVKDGSVLMDYLTGEEVKPPDVLFLDLNMPCKNGIECLTEIKHNKNLSGIPVVVYSTSVRPDVADILYNKGAHYYLQKANYSDLAKHIEDVLLLLLGNPEQPTRDQFIISEKDY